MDRKAEIKKLIWEARGAGEVHHGVARMVDWALNVTGDEAVLLGRLVDGSDPLSLAILLDDVPDFIRRAHIGDYPLTPGPEQDEWLLLCALSVDEAKPPKTLRGRMLQFAQAVQLTRTLPAAVKRALITAKLYEIDTLPWALEVVGGVKMRVYRNDFGSFHAYRDGEQVAAILGDDGYYRVGCRGTTLEALGVVVERRLSPTFGTIRK